MEDISVNDKKVNTLQTPYELSFERNYQGRLYSSRISEEVVASNAKKFELVNAIRGLNNSELKIDITNTQLSESEYWAVPKLKRFEFSQNNQSNTITAVLQITDEGEGIGSSTQGPRTRDTFGIANAIGAIRLIGPSGQQKVFAVKKNDRIEGDEFDGTYQVAINLSKEDEQGIWRLANVNLEDDGGNSYGLPIRIEKRNLASSGDVRSAAQARMFDLGTDKLVIDHVSGRVLNDSTAPELMSVVVRAVEPLPISNSNPPTTAPNAGGGGSSPTPVTTPVPVSTQPSIGDTPDKAPVDQPDGATSEAPAIPSGVLGIGARVAVEVVVLERPLVLTNVVITLAVIGTNQSDVITGSNEAEALAGGQGKDKLTGGGGPDAFVFET